MASRAGPPAAGGRDSAACRAERERAGNACPKVRRHSESVFAGVAQIVDSLRADADAGAEETDIEPAAAEPIDDAADEDSEATESNEVADETNVSEAGDADATEEADSAEEEVSDEAA